MGGSHRLSQELRTQEALDNAKALVAQLRRMLLRNRRQLSQGRGHGRLHLLQPQQQSRPVSQSVRQPLAGILTYVRL